MLRKEDVQRIEEVNEVMFQSGGVVGDYVKDKVTIACRILFVLGAIVFLGTLFFFSGMFSGKKEKPLEPIIK